MNKENTELKLFEELIDENIPRDLAKAYKNSAAYDSQRNQESRHSEIKNSHTYRRFTYYDYGKSSYESITPEAAIQLVKDNKYNIQKLRIIYDGDLVEYEVRDNGSIYAIYGNSSDDVVIDGKTYKNIRYAPWRKVLQNADKIYITDEYDHPLYNDQATQDRRADNKKQIKLGSMVDRNSPDFDRHKPFNNFMHNAISVPKQFDSGAHIVKNRYKDFNQKGVRNLIIAIDGMQTAYTRYDLARRYLKKLVAEKSDYEEAEYEELFSKAEEMVKTRLDAYNVIAKNVANLKSTLITSIDSSTAAINMKIQDYLSKLQNALDKGYALKKEFDDLLVQNVNNDLEVDYKAKQLRKAIERNLKAITEAQKELEKMQDANTGEIPSDTPAIIELAAKVDADLNSLEDIKNEYVVAQLKKFNDIEAQLAQIDQELAILKPKAAARKAANAAKSRTPELDPALSDIVQFTDFAGE